ncbi:2OG-Fe(II) oxygenase [Undibacterium sp. TC4M20W]|uniref:2OG-Fe(II) oxygenase n=1 Tax=Undibacterium sp. TC4M20W TaxID=3413052 RepID=UPI003BEFA22D
MVVSLMEVHDHGSGVHSIKGFLTEEECRRMIACSEQMQYEKAAIQVKTWISGKDQVRNNDRIIFDDATLAASIFERARMVLPAQLKEWTLSGLNERFRFYRYQAGQYFKWHHDLNFKRSETESSFFTLLIYLNADYAGGHTAFRFADIKPEPGMALLFPHLIPHQGTAIDAGIKYVLRTDVMYKKMAECH